MIDIEVIKLDIRDEYGEISALISSYIEFKRGYNSNVLTESVESVERVISKYVVNNSDEKILGKYLSHNLNLIEEGMQLLETQYRIPYGIIDILAKDVNSKLCIIELKTNKNDKAMIWQAAYYQSEFNNNDVRVIVISPDFSKRIASSLGSIKNTELKIYKLNNECLLEVLDFLDKNNVIIKKEVIFNV